MSFEPTTSEPAFINETTDEPNFGLDDVFMPDLNIALDAEELKARWLNADEELDMLIKANAAATTRLLHRGYDSELRGYQHKLTATSRSFSR